jgi:hypothetical protein
VEILRDGVHSSAGDRNFADSSFFYWKSLWVYITPKSPQKRLKAFLDLFSTEPVQPLH